MLILSIKTKKLLFLSETPEHVDFSSHTSIQKHMEEATTQLDKRKKKLIEVQNQQAKVRIYSLAFINMYEIPDPGEGCFRSRDTVLGEFGGKSGRNATSK